MWSMETGRVSLKKIGLTGTHIAEGLVSQENDTNYLQVYKEKVM